MSRKWIVVGYSWSIGDVRHHFGVSRPPVKLGKASPKGSRMDINTMFSFSLQLVSLVVSFVVVLVIGVKLVIWMFRSIGVGKAIRAVDNVVLVPDEMRCERKGSIEYLRKLLWMKAIAKFSQKEEDKVEAKAKAQPCVFVIREGKVVEKQGK